MDVLRFVVEDVTAGRAAGGAGAELTAFFKEGADGAGLGITIVPETDALKLAGFTEPVPNVPELMIFLTRGVGGSPFEVAAGFVDICPLLFEVVVSLSLAVSTFSDLTGARAS